MSNPRKVVIVGGVAGGASCAARARRLSEHSEIVVFERGPHVSFANCGLPYFIGREIKDAAKLQVQTPEKLNRNLALDVRENSEVLSIDRQRKVVAIRETNGGREYEESYDVLVLSPGAAPLKPPIPGIDRSGQFTLRNIPDMEAIDQWIDKVGAKSAVVVGGGYIGLEMVEQLRHRGLDVAVAEALPQVMAPLDAEMAELLHQELEAYGVRLYLGDPVAGFEEPAEGEEARASTVVLKSGQRLPGDIVILGLGVRPETSLARAAGLEIGDLGGIRVDEHMRTSDGDIYAIGDAVEVRHRVTNQWTLLPLAGPANRQGRVVADNIFDIPSVFKGSWGTAVLRLFDLTAACTGANSRQLDKEGITYVSLPLHPGSHAGYYPGAQPISMKILFDPTSGHLLGAQAVGRDGVDKRIDVLATAMAGGLTVDDIAEVELAYAPPYGSAKDPVNMAGMAAQNVKEGLVRIATAADVAGRDEAATVVLDVRDAPERDKFGFIEGSVNIPLGELRRRLGELPRDREIIVHCMSGQRSYMACRILVQEGFKARNFAGSWKTWQQRPRG
ncbi:MAG: FAD-dependent oxidoreductase [Candidatus Sumerlaeia bacterium]|nr:FAD-dependent oxidoreductase [Candidatus Sumerlaeia bacterium]